MKKFRNIISLSLFILILWTGCLHVFACEFQAETGSVKITLICQDEAETGGSLTLYRVGDVNSAVSGFVCTEEFRKSGVDLLDISDLEIVDELVRYINTHSVQGITQEISETGEVVFKDCQIGLYLVLQSETISGYDSIRPFLVSIPMESDGEYVYDVDATPKISLNTQPEESSEPSESSEVFESSESFESSGSSKEASLPQTGQLNWPVLVMGILGAVLLLTGLILCYGRKKHEE